MKNGTTTSATTVTQASLRKYQEAQSAIQAVEEQLKAVKAQYKWDALEKGLKAAVESGAEVEEGRYTAYVTDGRVCPAWKSEWEVLAAKLGLDPVKEEEAVKAKTVPSKKLVVAVKAGVEAAHDEISAV